MMQRVEKTFAGRKLVIETGRMAKQASGSAVVQFGETVVMFSRYSVVTEGEKGRATRNGRATEVFVRTNGRWVHTSWHLDAEP